MSVRLKEEQTEKAWRQVPCVGRKSDPHLHGVTLLGKCHSFPLEDNEKILAFYCGHESWIHSNAFSLFLTQKDSCHLDSGTVVTAVWIQTASCSPCFCFYHFKIVTVLSCRCLLLEHCEIYKYLKFQGEKLPNVYLICKLRNEALK